MSLLKHTHFCGSSLNSDFAKPNMGLSRMIQIWFWLGLAEELSGFLFPQTVSMTGRATPVHPNVCCGFLRRVYLPAARVVDTAELQPWPEPTQAFLLLHSSLLPNSTFAWCQFIACSLEWAMLLYSQHCSLQHLGFPWRFPTGIWSQSCFLGLMRVQGLSVRLCPTSACSPETRQPLLYNCKPP